MTKTRSQLGTSALSTTLVVILLMLGMGGIMAWMVGNQSKILSAQERRYESYRLADELRQSSDDLTRLARTYVTTGDARYESHYWTVLNIRNGTAPRPLEYGRIYWDFMAVDGVKPRPDGKVIALRQLMEDQGFTEAEFAKLKEAQDNSDGLVKIETIAMNAVKGLFDDGNGSYSKKGEPNPELARKLMNSREYHLEKARIMRPIDEFFVMLDQRTQSEVQNFVRRGYILFYTLLGMAALTIVVVIRMCATFFTKIIRPLDALANELFHASQELEGASSQLARSSQNLSAGANHQASSVEETSASLEEISSMVRATADNAHKAKTVASETRLMAQTGSGNMVDMDRTMGEMNQAMAAIEFSSGEVAKIVKGIDEIAFQTNILALNAAVEAARAGEAGAGFAVVADEVRSLAQRSAAAAKETAAKIEAAIASSRNGSASCRNGSASSLKVGESLKNIADKISATDALVADIATAAQEQTQGIEQINRAIGEMEQVTQSNASSAEESASAAEELAAQAETLNELVSKLRELVGGADAAPAPLGSTPGGAPGVASGFKVRSTVAVESLKTAAHKPAPPLPAKNRIRIDMPQEPPSRATGEERDFRNF